MLVDIFLYLFIAALKFDGFVKSRDCSLSVIPTKAGILCSQLLAEALDPVFQQGDDFLRNHQV